MPPELLRVDLGHRGYDIAIVTDEAADLGAFVTQRSQAKSALVISDQNVAPFAERVARDMTAAGLRTALAMRPPGEAQKSLAVAAALYEELLDLPADRRTLVVAVGGGVIGDLAGFVAATFARGLPLLMVPTTLLAMVDSSVGGKVAVNLPRAKNMVGAFHQPIGVWINLSALATLPGREYRSGLAEVVKYGVIADAAFFAYLEANVPQILEREASVIRRIVSRCCRIKADVVEKDEREETGLRAGLNYGHTFAHAFETAAGYGAWLHGEAVAAGMICASRLAARRGLIDSEITERQIRLLKALSLPTRPEAWPIEQMLAVMRADKKALGGQMLFVLPTRLGEVRVFDDIDESDVRATLAEAN
ncbi:MAG: 3-dehydroquinate synthase [Planctomycetes bacterium]|nr:3-dehydroquinate synthase [Planctomycetota bacterium]